MLSCGGDAAEQETKGMQNLTPVPLIPSPFARAHFKEYGDFALIYEAVYYVTIPDYSRYMDIQQAINLEIYRRFEQEGVDFAYPTQTLFVNADSSAQPQVPATRPGETTS